MKRLLLLLLVVSFAACGPKPTPPSLVPPTNWPPKAASEAPQPKAPINARTVKVGLLLPLSNESSSLGNAMLDAAMLAVYDKYVSLPPEKIYARVILVPKDSGNSPKEAEAAVRSVIEQGAQLIIGPVFGHEAQSVAAVAKEKNIPVLSFTNTRAAAGWPVFVLGFLPDQQAARIADFAFRKEITHLGALAPNDAYGQAVTQTLSGVYRLKNAAAEPIEVYGNTGQNLDGAAARFAKAVPPQGLVIADDVSKMPTVLAALRKQKVDVSKMKLMGLGNWDDAKIAAIAELRGGWLVSASPQYDLWFRQRFQSANNYAPPRLAGMAYDATAFAIELINTPSGEAPTQSALTEPQGFIGPANGLFRLLPDGTNERGLAVLEIGPQGLRVIDPAPISFGATGRSSMSSAPAGH